MVGGQFGEEDLGEAEAGEILHAHRVQDALQVIALVLHHAGMEALGDAVDGVAVLVVAGIAQARVGGTTPRRPGTDRQPSQPSSIASDSGSMVGLISTVLGTAGASG